jgi:hypothetical protein
MHPESFKTLADPPKRVRWGKRGDNDGYDRYEHKTQQMPKHLPGKRGV